LTKAGLAGLLPRIVPCGSRKAAYDDFCLALKNGNRALLLVDSEDLVDVAIQANPWVHLANREGDKWSKPENAEDRHCHLMVVCMESWFLADQSALATFFGQGFCESALPPSERPLESIPKSVVYDALKNATMKCKTKAAYGKAEHSFELLSLIDPQKVTKASKWANRFIEELKS
jgi:hypothetical protein